MIFWYILLAHNTLFRGKSILPRVVGYAMKQYGQDWLESTIGDHIREMCDSGVAIHVDEISTAKGTKNQEQKEKNLTEWCDRIWGSIWGARDDCPW
jgi:hypothetical protein